MKKILVIEDDKEIVHLLKYNLENNGYTVLTAYNGESGLSIYHKSTPDLIILDLMLPQIDGIELCKIIRKESLVPIIMVTAKREEADRVLGLELGADDYITKPFSVVEFLARVKSVLRRAKEKETNARIIKVGKLSIDLDRYEVKVNGSVIELSTKEFEFLKVLVNAKGKLLSREQLIESVWGRDKITNIDMRTVDQNIARLRTKLELESDRLITVKKFGYRLRAD